MIDWGELIAPHLDVEDENEEVEEEEEKVKVKEKEKEEKEEKIQPNQSPLYVSMSSWQHSHGNDHRLWLEDPFPKKTSSS
jgi:hypothetical protein